MRKLMATNVSPQSEAASAHMTEILDRTATRR